jgi:4-nitrophenyl phosphatase
MEIPRHCHDDLPLAPGRTVRTLPRVSVDFSPYQAVLLDLDGTVYHEEVALPGAIALIARLQREGRRFACLSNSTLSPVLLVERLMDMGVELDPDQIYTAAAAACDYVLHHFPKKKTGHYSNGDTVGAAKRMARVFNLSSEAVENMLEGSVDWVQTGAEPCDVLIVGSPTNVFATEERLRTGLQLLRSGAALIGICADRVYPSPRGIEFGAGAQSWMLGYAAGVEPIFCGKPEPIFFETLCERLGVDPTHCVLIGDTLEADIAGAKAVGMRTILTLTGVTRASELKTVAAEYQPDMVVEDLVELI